jgi:hypothetical protein
MLIKQALETNKGWSSSLGVGEVLTTPRRNNLPCYEPFTRNLTWTKALVQTKYWKRTRFSTLGKRGACVGQSYLLQ